MSLLFLLPVITFIGFAVSIINIIKNSKDKNIKYLVLYCFMIGTSLVISIIETVVIYHYHGLDNQIIKENMLFFIILLLINLLFSLAKGIIVTRELKKDEPDYGKATLKLNGIDPISLILLIVTVIIFKK